MNRIPTDVAASTRRSFFRQSSGGLGAIALAHLLGESAGAANHFAPKAKRVISLFMHGGPSHLDLFDYKPALERMDGRPLPEGFAPGVRFAQISRQTSRPLLRRSPFPFARHGQSGQWISELLPHLAAFADDLAIVRSVHSAESTHDSAVHLLTTGFNRVGRPTLGAWLSYGLGADNANLPAYVVLTSGARSQPLLDSYWSGGCLPGQHQGVEFRSIGDPVLFLSMPEGVSAAERRDQLDLIQSMNRRRYDVLANPDIQARIAQYELAFRMQTAIPELVDLGGEKESTLTAYGARPGERSFAANCLLARRLAERGARFIQLFDMGWDTHQELTKQLPRQCRAVDRPIAALLRDLKERGLLEDTLVIWGGEFDRTPVIEGAGRLWGRDHHPHGFTMWLAGGGARSGASHGATDEFGFFARENPVEVHDIHATILRCLGFDHEKFTFPHNGQDVRLTDVRGRVIPELLA